MSIDFGFQ